MGLKKNFVEDRLLPLSHIPTAWGYDAIGNNYVLDLRMSFLRELQYDFLWGDEKNPVVRAMPITEQPSRILKVDVSLNDLRHIDGHSLEAFRELRSLNAAVNRIVSFGGISVCKKLRHLDLSYNFITELSNLQFCAELLELRLNHNHLQSLETLPRLYQVVYLNVDGNKLTSLSGIQRLVALQEISARNNHISDITALVTCRNLIQVDLMDNQVDDLEQSTEILRSLPKLQDLSLLRNPIAAYPSYRQTMVAVLSLKSLDGVSLIVDRKETIGARDLSQPGTDIEVFRELAKKAYMERIKQSRADTQENVRHLQKRIIAMLDDQDYLEKKLMNEMDATLSHIDFLDRQTLENFRDIQLMRGREDHHFDAPMYRHLAAKERAPRAGAERGEGGKGQDTEDVLRLAAVKLTRDLHQQERRPKNVHPAARTPLYEPEYFH